MFRLHRSRRLIEQWIKTPLPAFLNSFRSFIQAETPLSVHSPTHSRNSLLPSRSPNSNPLVLSRKQPEIPRRPFRGHVRPWEGDVPGRETWNVVDYTKDINRCLRREGADGLRIAEELFNEMKTSGIEPDVVAYISMMQGYSKIGRNERLYGLYAEMLESGIEPTEVTFTILIHACTHDKNLDRALELFLQMKAHSNLKPNLISYNALLNVCAKSGHLRKAKEVYEEMTEAGIAADSFTLSTMIDAYAACSHAGNCSKHFRECRTLIEDALQSDGDLFLDRQMFNALIKLCSRGGLVKSALWVHSKMKRRAIQPTSHTYTSLLSTCAMAGDLTIAEKLWQEMEMAATMKTVNVLNAMINVYAECIDRVNAGALLERCQSLVRSVEAEGMRCNAWTFNSLIKLCTRGASMTEAMGILGQMKRRGMEPSIVTYNSLIDGYAKATHLSMDEIVIASTAVIQEMKEKDIVPDVATFTALINLCLCLRDLNRARKYLKHMQFQGIQPNAITYGALIKCHEKLGDPRDKAAYLRPIFDLYKKLKARKLSTDDHGYTSMISACAKASDLPSALWIWKELKNSGIPMTVISFCAMITVCLRADAYDQAIGFLEEMESTGVAPNAIVFRSFFLYLLRMGDGRRAVDVVERMHKCKVKPDDECRKMLKELKLM